MKKIGWAILGAGNIARSFAQDLRLLPDAELLAIGSRSMDKAQQFANELQVPRAYGSYEDLVADPDIDVVYIATPHVFHKDQSLLCLNAGKGILVEKPFTMNAAEAREVVACARERNLFCMEAMWMRFAPAMREVVKLVEQNVIGDLQMITASLGFYNAFDPQHRLFNPDLGGGAMLDLGVYPLSLIVQLLGRPLTISSQASIGASNVDENAAVLLGFPDGKMAQLSTNIRAHNRNDAFLIGSQGSIYIHPPLYCPTTLTVQKFAASSPGALNQNSLVGRLKRNQFVRNMYQLLKGARRLLRGDQAIQLPSEGNGYLYEAAEAGRCLQAGLIESAIMPHDETIAIMETMDAIRDQWSRDS